MRGLRNVSQCRQRPFVAYMAFIAAAAVFSAAALAQTTGALPEQQTGNTSGLPLPRFVSLESDRVNLRSGPGTEYPTSWVFRRAGIPVEVIKEVDAGRQVRDGEGANRWVLNTML